MATSAVAIATIAKTELVVVSDVATQKNNNIGENK